MNFVDCFRFPALAAMLALLAFSASSVFAQTVVPPPTNLRIDETCTAPAYTPGGSNGRGGCFPGPANTGVPTGTVLTSYTGPCTITAANTVIDAKTVNCDMEIRATGVRITRSVINGQLVQAGGGSFSVSDSNVNMGSRPGTAIGEQNFTVTRVHITGGNKSINCDNDCTIEYSYVHGQFRDSTGTYHESGIRMSQNGVIRGNTISCDAPEVPPDAGCSASLTGYGDFMVVKNNLIDGNLFIAGGSQGFCAYGGSTQGKPYSSGVNNIRFTNNVWQRGSNGKCGNYGPITAFDVNAPGNVWTNNKWDNGTVVQPAM